MYFKMQRISDSYRSSASIVLEARDLVARCSIGATKKLVNAQLRLPSDPVVDAWPHLGSRHDTFQIRHDQDQASILYH